ncbi:MAG: hypothetical protein NVS9B6_09660 [Candidatus Limnocylindrales bacterium]
MIARIGIVLALILSLSGSLMNVTAAPASAFALINVDGYVYLPGGAPAVNVCAIFNAVPDQCRDTYPRTDATGHWVLNTPIPNGSPWSVWYSLAGYQLGHDTIPATQSTDWHGSFTLTASAGTTPPPSTNPCTTTGTAASTTYLPNITRRLGGPSGWDTPFYVQNAGSAAATIEASFYFFDTGGFATCHKYSSLGAGASIVDDPNSASDLLDGKQYSVVVKSFGSASVAAVNQTQITASGALEALSYAGFNGGNTTVYVPNVTRRFYGYDVPLIVQNLGTSSTNVTATFTSFDGTQIVNIPLTIGVGLSAVIDPDFTAGLTDQTQYAVQLTSAQPIGVVANAHNEAIGPVAFSLNGLAVGAASIYAPYATKKGGSTTATTFSPVVIQNVGGAPATATLTFTPLGGGTTQAFSVANIPAGRSQAFDVRFANGLAIPGLAECRSASATCLGDGDYSVTINSGGLIAAVVLPNSNTTADGFLAAVAPTSKVLLPVAQRNAAGWNGSIYLQSVSAASATLSYYQIGSGALATTQTVTLVPGSTLKISPATVAGLADGQTYSVVITGTGTLAAVVAEENSAAGDGLMMYEGFAQ